MYAAKFGVEFDKMMEKLWGDNFFDPKTKKWTKTEHGEKPRARLRAVLLRAHPPRLRQRMNDNKDKLWPMLEEAQGEGEAQEGRSST